VPETLGQAWQTIVSREDLRICRYPPESDQIDLNGQEVGTEICSLVLVMLRLYLMHLNDGSAFRVNALLMKIAIAIRNEYCSYMRASDSRREVRQGRRIYDDIPQPFCRNEGVNDNVMRRG
jgi:hypothetical protein